MENNMDKEKGRMRAFDVLRGFIVAFLLGPGLVVAAGSETAVPNEQPMPAQDVPAIQPDRVPSPAMWLPMMAVARPPLYYWTPPAGMMWPALPQFPARMAMPPVVWVLMPVPATLLTPAQVDYGPVSDTPVVELPVVDPAIAQTTLEDAALAATVTQAGNREAGPAVSSGVEAASPAATNSQTPATRADEPVAPPAAPSVSAMPVDYGPVAPTPVIELPVLQTHDAGSDTPEPSQVAPKPVRKTGTSGSPKAIPTAKSAPAKRMCWSKGVVAPCR
jgi:hypothetical protein